MRWCLFIEEYSPDLQYIKGKNNIVADALSQLDILFAPIDKAHVTDKLHSYLYAYGANEKQDDKFPLWYHDIKEAQDKDKDLMKVLKKSLENKSGKYHFKGVGMLCHTLTITIASHNKTYILNRN